MVDYKGVRLPRFAGSSLLSLVSLVTAACGPDPERPELPDGEPPVATLEQPVWVNGDFEADAIGTTPPSGWTISSNLNNNITDTRPNPQTLSSLNLATGGALMTAVVGGLTEAMTDPDLLLNGTLRFPKYGARAARVNATTAATGVNRNVNTMKQTMVASLGDVDATDGKVHIRFTIAPILENPAHTYISQPYYFVRVQNLTKAITIYQDFNTSGQPGVPWKDFTDTSGNPAQYTDWMLVDVAPGDAQLAVGDQVELTIVAAGCSLGGHWGRVYVDGVGSGVPGLFTWATGPQSVNAGSSITYTVNYKNGGTTTTSNTKIDLVTPPSTTYQAVSLGGACTTPAVGATGTVSCSLGTLAPGSTGSYTVTVNVPAGTANGTVVTNGNYSIYATGSNALIGPKVNTTVTAAIAYADLGVTFSDGIAALGWGQPTTYQLTVTNGGPVNAPSVTVANTVPAQLTNVTWTCAGTGGGSCAASGTGSINDATASLPVGATVRYTINASVIAGSGNGQVVNTASASVASPIVDPDTSNNTAVDTNAIGNLRTVTLNKLGTIAAGSVTSTPSSISCGTSCSAASGQFLEGAQVVLTAAPIAGAVFNGWGGACSGTATTCTLTMSADRTVTASFTGPTLTITGGNNQLASTNAAFLLPLQVRVTDANGIAVVGATVTFTPPASGASATLSATTATTNLLGFASVTATATSVSGSYQVTASVPGADPVAFTLTNVGAPASIAVSSGSPQTTVVGTAFAAPLVAIVRDLGNQPVGGVTVTFAVPGSGASATLSATTAVTDASGRASVTATANTVAGTFNATASVGLASATFGLTNTPGAPANLTLVAPTTRSATINASLGTFTAEVTDAFGNVVPGVTVSFAAPASGASATLSAASAVTAANGRASITATANTVAGAYAITASATGTTSRSFTLTNTPGAAASVTVVSGTPQTTAVTTAFAAPLVVLVRDAFANPIPGATVTFAAPASGASATVTTTATTNAAGQAQTSATATTVAGSYNVTATVAGVSPVSFALTNTAGAAAALTVVSGTPQTTAVTTAFAAALIVRVADANGNPVAGASVTFTRPASGASATLSSLTVTTAANGQAQVSATAGTIAGAYSVTAATTGVAAPVSFALTNTPGPAATLTLIAPTTRTATVGSSLGTFTAEVTDAQGNLVPGVTVSFAAPASGASATLSAASAVTAANGRASITATANTIAGAYAITASATGATAQSFSITNTAGAAAALTVVSGTPQTTAVTTAFAAALIVRVADANGNPVAGASVTFTRPASGASATLSSLTVTTAANGQAQVSATAGTIAGAYSVTAATTGVAAPVSFALTNTPGPAAALEVVAGGAQSAEVTDDFAAPLTLRVVDAHGNPVAGVAVTFASPATGASAELSATTVTTGANGQAQITATANTVAGTYSVTASATGLAVSASFDLTNTAGPAAEIAIVGGSDQRAEIETAFAEPLRVVVRDAFGNLVPGATVTFSAPASGATATLDTTVTTDASGNAQSDATAGSIAGAYQVTATVGGVATPVSFDLTNSPAGATTIEIVSGDAQQTIVDTRFAQPLAVRLRDRAGNPVPGATVRFQAPGASPSALLSSGAVLTDATGLAQVLAEADTRAGSYAVTAELSPGLTATFALQNLPDAPAQLTVAPANSPQSITVLDEFVEPLAVQVVDRFGNPTPGVTVTFAVPATGASAALSSLTAVTDASGRAQVIATANAVAGVYLATAAVVGIPDASPIHLTNLAGAPSFVSVESGDAQATEVDTAFAAPLTVLVVDAQGNPVPGAVVSFNASPDAVSAVLSASAVATGSDGRAQVTARASTAAGQHSVNAVIGNGAAPAVFALTNTPGAPAAIEANLADTPQQTQVGTPYPRSLGIRVVDRFANPVPGVSVTYAAPTAGASGALSATTVTTDAGGQGSVFATANTLAGSFEVTAAVAGVAAPARFSLTNLPGPAHRLVLVSGDEQATEVDTAFAQQLVVRVTDEFGNSVPGQLVTFTAPAAPATASLAPLTVTSDADGLASTSATASTVIGSYDVTATSAQGAVPVLFELTNLAGAPASAIAAPGASPQTAEVRHAFGAPLGVIVMDRFGNRVPGVVVTYTAPTGPGATLSSTTATTDLDGDTHVLAIADATIGTYQVTASVPGLATPVIFVLTNTVSAVRSIVVARGAGQITTATTAFAAPLVFRIVDAFGNPVAGGAISVVMTRTGAGAAMTTSSNVSDASGEVSFDLVANGVVGMFAVTATAAGAGGMATAVLQISAIPTQTTLEVPADVALGEDATVTVRVTATLGTPAGAVQLLGDAGELLATAELVAGSTEVEVPMELRGQRQLTARYLAQGSYGASTSAAVTFEVGEDRGSINGTTCSAGSAGGHAGGLWPVMMALLLGLCWRRRRAAPAAAANAATGARLAAPLTLAVLGLVALHAAPAHAQEAPAATEDVTSRSVNRFHAASAESSWFSADSLEFGGDLDVALALTWDYASRPLVVYEADGVTRTVVVESSLVAHATASVALKDLVRLSASAPMAVYQDGNDGMFNGEMLPEPQFAFGDMYLAGDVRLVGEARSALRAAVGVRVTVPTGQRGDYMSDSKLAIEPRGTLAASRGRLELAASVGAFLRSQTELATESFGSELRYTASAGVRLMKDQRLLIGPEVIGALSLAGDGTGNPTELGAGAHYRVNQDFHLGLGASAGIVNAVGVPDARVFLNLAWKP